MTDFSITRRQLLAGTVGMACGTAVAGLALPRPAFADTPPYPILPAGRPVPRDLEEYDRAMLSGGPGKDGIPSIDNPTFWDAQEADGYLDGDDIVFGLIEGGEARAYPQRILVWHEIVNDVVNDVGLAVTYCPLTGTAILFERGGTEFGVSGRLVNSNLVMYDRDTDTWFPQILAVGIRGPHAGAALVERPMVWTTWERWRSANPETLVLSTETGFARNYQHDPYGTYNPLSGYYQPDAGTMFPLMNEDGSHPPKSVFIGARTNEATVAVKLDSLREAGRLDIESQGRIFTAVYDNMLDTGYIFRGHTAAEFSIDGAGPHAVTWSDGTTPTLLNAFEAMWFAWMAFYPETTVHDG